MSSTSILHSCMDPVEESDVDVPSEALLDTVEPWLPDVLVVPLEVSVV